jgi:hypothetical protein
VLAERRFPDAAWIARGRSLSRESGFSRPAFAAGFQPVGWCGRHHLRAGFSRASRPGLQTSGRVRFESGRAERPSFRQHARLKKIRGHPRHPSHPRPLFPLRGPFVRRGESTPRSSCRPSRGFGLLWAPGFPALTGTGLLHAGPPGLPRSERTPNPESRIPNPESRGLRPKTRSSSQRHTEHDARTARVCHRRGGTDSRDGTPAQGRRPALIWMESHDLKRHDAQRHSEAIGGRLQSPVAGSPVMAPANDPFNCGGQAQIEQGKWFSSSANVPHRSGGDTANRTPANPKRTATIPSFVRLPRCGSDAQPQTPRDRSRGIR